MDIWRRHRKIMDDRHKFMSAAMEEYDKTVFYPSLKELREECAKEGHNFEGSEVFNNWLGRAWVQCVKCGSSKDLE